MLRRLRKLSGERTADGEDRIIKYVRECHGRGSPQECLKEALLHAEVTGNPGKLLISLGSLLLVNPSITIASLVSVISDAEVGSKARRSLSTLIKIGAYLLGPYQLFNSLIESQKYVGEVVMTELLSSADCIDLVRIGEVINSDGRVPSEYVIDFIKEVMGREGCLSGKEEGLKAAISLLRRNEISLNQLKELLGKKKLRILIARKGGKVDKVFLYIGDELVTEGAGKDYVVDLLSLSSQLNRNSVQVYS